MREILFKAKRIDNGEWVQGYYIKKQEYCTSPHAPVWYDEHYICIPVRNEDYEFFQDIEIVPKTISQYTGLKYKNGNKIFENDIIKFANGAIYFIIYEDYMFKISNETHREALLESEYDDFMVIGNKFDNPELLGEE